MKVIGIICVLAITYISRATSIEAPGDIPSLLTIPADAISIIDGPDHHLNLEHAEEKSSQRDASGKGEVNQLNEVVKSIRLQITDALREVVNQIINQLKQILNDVRKRVLIKLSKVTMSDLFVLLFGGISELVATPTHQNHYPEFRPQVYHNQKLTYNHNYKDNNNEIDLFSYEPEYNDEEDAYYKSIDLADVPNEEKADVKISDAVAEVRDNSVRAIGEETKKSKLVPLPLLRFESEQGVAKKASYKSADINKQISVEHLVDQVELRAIDVQSLKDDIKKEPLVPLPFKEDKQALSE